ncbi:MAG: histone deacetylase, partial [Desulfitobacterium sp.]|nr:histone deacetylase [Desulfitobacterium sp.]
ESALIRIPFEACPQCSQAGYDLWETFVRGRKISVLLQDQLQNKVQLWHKDKGVTTY